ncbi:MAG: hypothetical protein ACO1PM_18270 [Acidovorax sp.]
MDPAYPSPVNCCGICGATSYLKLIARDANGAMRPTELLRSTCCEREFANVPSWRQDVPWDPASPEAWV